MVLALAASMLAVLLPSSVRPGEVIRQLEIAGNGTVEIAVSIFMIVARFVIVPETETLPLRLRQGAAMIAIGLVTLACSRGTRMYDWARVIGWVSGFAAGAPGSIRRWLHRRGLNVPGSLWARRCGYSSRSSPSSDVPRTVRLGLGGVNAVRHAICGASLQRTNAGERCDDPEQHDHGNRPVPLRRN